MGKRRTIEEFIADAMALHGDTYDYSKVVYTQNKAKVPIICRIHGEFLQSPNAHLRGAGCPVCSYIVRTVPLEEQIRRANIIHQSKYNYSLIDPTT